MNNKWWGIRLRSMETIRRKLIQRRIKTLVFWMKRIFMIVIKRIFCLCILLYNWQILIHCNDTNSNNDRLSVGFSLSDFPCRFDSVGIFVIYNTIFKKSKISIFHELFEFAVIFFSHHQVVELQSFFIHLILHYVWVNNNYYYCNYRCSLFVPFCVFSFVFITI